MPGGTGDETPVAATSKRSMFWPSKVSPLGCHHSGATPAVAGPAGTDAVPVHSQAWLLFQVVTALVAATAVSSKPTPRATATASKSERLEDGPAPAPDHQPQSEGDHGLAPVSVLTLPSLTTTSRSA